MKNHARIGERVQKERRTNMRITFDNLIDVHTGLPVEVFDPSPIITFRSVELRAIEKAAIKSAKRLKQIRNNRVHLSK